MTKYHNTFQDRFVDEYVTSQVLRDGSTLSEIGTRAGYSPHTAGKQASELLTKPAIQKAISDKLVRLQPNVEWTLAISLREGITQYERLRDGLPSQQAIGFKYKENLDKIMGLLIERKLTATVRIGDKRKNLQNIPTDQLQEELLERLKLGPGSIETGIDSVERVPVMADSQECV